MSELKPCAHCGSVYTQVRWIGFTHTHNGAFEAGYRGECTECGVITRAYHTEAEAIKAWNRRANDASSDQAPEKAAHAAVQDV